MNYITEIDGELKKINFKINSIPVELLKEFKQFCKTECGDVYWVGIFQLMKIKKQYEQALTHFNLLQTQIDELKSLSNKQVKEEPQTFGK